MRRRNTGARNGLHRRTLLAGLAGATVALPGSNIARAEPKSIPIGYVRSLDRRPTISLLDQPAPDDGLAGANLGIEDNNTTGRFLGQSFELIDAPVHADADVTAALARVTGAGAGFVLTDLTDEDVLALSDAARASHAVILNIAAPDNSLRQEDCRANVINVAPSRDMLADAVAQYLVWKKWGRWVLVSGSHPGDIKLADAYRRAAKRFGARIVAERVSKDTGGSRDTDSGVTQTQQQMPVLTQGLPDYDVLVAADENQVFAGYLPYRTWDPRPVAGSAGLEPVTWDASSDSWGGAQLQSRFIHHFHRRMTALDMQAWTAVRMVGEAASRAGATDNAALVAYMLGPNFGIAAYKGQKLTLRDWDLQLRQPILLSDGRTIVSISPQPGFLHQVTELDTLGIDRPESKCKLK